MIETPSASIAATKKTPNVPADGEEIERLLDESVEVELHPVKPITSKIRSTLRHVKSIGGRRAYFRGFFPHLVYLFMVVFWSQALMAVFPAVVGKDIIVSTIVSVAFANIHMAYLHAVISMPSTKYWYQRLGDFKAFKTLAVPITICSLISCGIVYILAGIITLAGIGNFALLQSDSHRAYSYVALPLTVLAIVIIAIALFLFIALPAEVAMIRVEASMLPEEHDTIVPFDRTFGGLTVPPVLGGTGAISFLDAWKTVSWEARRRITKLYAKILVILGSIVAIAGILIAVQFLCANSPRAIVDALAKGDVVVGYGVAPDYAEPHFYKATPPQ